MGTWMNATGTEGDSFLEVSSALPYFPSSLPVTHRKTYWRLERSCACASSAGAGSHIVLIASFHELLLALCDALGHGCGFDGSGYVALVADVKRRLDGEARAGKRDHSSSDKTKPIMHEAYAARVQGYLAEFDNAVWAQRPKGVARPVLLHDYHALAEYGADPCRSLQAVSYEQSVSGAGDVLFHCEQRCLPCLLSCSFIANLL
jgi:hypothetical protein